MTVTDLASAEWAPPRRHRQRWRLFLPVPKLSRALLAGLLSALVLAPLYADTSHWLGLGIALTTFVLVHGASAAYVAPWVPGAMALGACVQWVLAPWFVYILQDNFAIPPMVVPPDQYFTFAVPSALAYVVGLYLPIWRRGAAARAATESVPVALAPRLQATCEAMVVGGVALRLIVLPAAPYSLRFALYLASLLAFVGAMALCIMATKGWYLRLMAVLAVSALDNAASLQFLELLLWCACIGLVICYRYRPRPSTVLALLGPGLLLFTAINAFKMLHREEVKGMSLESRERAALTSTAVLELARDPSTALGTSNLVATVSRLNEGFVTTRLLAWTPAAEPFAQGETVVAAFRAALVPRVLDPGKYVAGGAEIVPRFTGISLINGTSISLSIPGEMYANFGLAGAWIGTFLFGVMLGRIYGFFARRASAAPVWWAWMPLILFGSLSAEQSVGEIVNSISKALLVMLVAIRLLPGWRSLPRSVRAQRAGRMISKPFPVAATAAAGD